MLSTILCGPASPGTIKVGIYLPVHTENNLRNEFSFKIVFLLPVLLTATL